MKQSVTVSKAGGEGPANNAASAELKGKVTQLEGQLQEIKLQNDTLEKERLFYFDKLQEIEFLLQARQSESNDGLGADILKILYASEDEKVTIENGGKLTITGPDGTISATGGPGGTEATPAAADEEIEKEEIVDEEIEQEAAAAGEDLLADEDQ